MTTFAVLALIMPSTALFSAASGPLTRPQLEAAMSRPGASLEVPLGAAALTTRVILVRPGGEIDSDRFLYVYTLSSPSDASQRLVPNRLTLPLPAESVEGVFEGLGDIAVTRPRGPAGVRVSRTASHLQVDLREGAWTEAGFMVVSPLPPAYGRAAARLPDGRTFEVTTLLPATPWLDEVAPPFRAATADPAARIRFTAAQPTSTRMVWDQHSGLLKRASGTDVLLAGEPDPSTIGPLATAALGDLEPLLGVGTDQLKMTAADFDPPRNAGGGRGTWYLTFQQTVAGVPVLNAALRLVVRGASIASLQSSLIRLDRRDAPPRISAGEALDRLRGLLGEEAAPLPESCRLVAWPRRDGVAAAAWELVLPPQREPALHLGEITGLDGQRLDPQTLVPVQWRIIVDARSGGVLARDNVVVSETLQGRVTGPVFPARPDDVKETRPLQQLQVRATGAGGSATSVTDTDGRYALSSLAAGSTLVEASLAGPHLVVKNAETESGAVHQATVTVPGNHDWDWAVDDTSPDDTETNAFYHVARVMEWFLRGGSFDVGPDPDPMVATVRDGAYCNAYASEGGITFASGVAGSCADFSLCADIVYHEYTHRVVGAVYKAAAVELPYQMQTGAMNEGWADFFGCVLANSPEHGTGCYRGRNIDTPDQRFPDDWAGEVHADGLMFSGSLWDLRSELGTEYVETLAMRAMKHGTVSFSDYLGALLLEDDDPSVSSDPVVANNDLGDGSPNAQQVCHAFYDLHGISHPACVGWTETPLIALVQPSPLQFSLVDESESILEIRGTATGSRSSAFASLAIELGSMTHPGSWSSAAVQTVATSAVADGVIGTVDLNSLAEDFYLVRVTVTDTSGESSSTLSSFSLDRTLQAGWPQAMGEHFSATPAVFDIDRDTGGLELLAVSLDGNAYAWHEDGTPVGGWPRRIGGTYSSPAVADLDGDGQVEVIVLTSFNGLHVMGRDGSERHGWPRGFGAAVYFSSPAVGDIDGDGDLEIAFTDTRGRAHVYHHDGSVAAGWPVALGAQEAYASPAVADLDGDGRDEVIVGDTDGWLHALSWNGAELAGWPRQAGTDTRIMAGAAVGDLDGDGDVEIVVANQPRDIGTTTPQVFSWHHDGAPLSGWPRNLTMHCGVMTSASLADMDGDQLPEVVLLTNDDSIHVLDGDGSPVQNWPRNPYEGGFYEFYGGAVSISDLDGDLRPEAVAEMYGAGRDGVMRFEAFAYDTDGLVLPGWPRTLSTYSNSSVTVADVDGDGDVEVVVGSDGVFVWDLPGGVLPGAAEWPTYRGDLRRSGRYRSAGDSGAGRARRKASGQ